ncbi:MAG: NUMOD3 domain-containing DNA-binding protein [Candidatus Pacearchaeota archaeon]|nr:NUMOD3 domain-containing DNA-binding protein [Candidatus Pacearchaeota archaeon]
MIKGSKHSKETKIRLSEFNKGFHSSPRTEFKKGLVPWNKGIPMNEETKKKLSNSHKGKPAWNKGKSPSQESKKKMSEAQKKRTSNPEWKKRQSEMIKKVWLNPEIRKRQSESHKGQISWMKGKKHSPESLLKMSQSHKNVSSNLEVKKRMSQAQRKRFEKEIPWMKGKKHSPETRLKIIESIKKVMSNPEVRKKNSERNRKNILRLYESGTFPRQENTKPERQIKEELLKRRYIEDEDFIHQYKFMNKFMCDFCFPQQKVIVEVYGDFWHANPKKYPISSKLHPHQIKDIGRDKSKEAYIRKVDNGSWTYLILWESDINKNVSECVDKIEEVLAEKKTDLNKRFN